MVNDGLLTAQQAVIRGVRAAEAILDEIRAQVTDMRSKEAIGQAIADYMDRHGEPRFRIACFACGEYMVDLPLVFQGALGNWTWMPPAYYAARFNHEEQYRACPACGSEFPAVDLRTTDPDTSAP